MFTVTCPTCGNETRAIRKNKGPQSCQYCLRLFVLFRKGKYFEARVPHSKELKYKRKRNDRNRKG